MPKLEKLYDARLQIKLEAVLKRELERYAKRHKISVNELARRAFRHIMEERKA